MLMTSSCALDVEDPEKKRASGGPCRLQRRCPDVEVRTDRLQFATVERPQALDTAEPLAIPLGSVLI